jgi:hypothetical protein
MKIRTALAGIVVLGLAPLMSACSAGDTTEVPETSVAPETSASPETQVTPVSPEEQAYRDASTPEWEIDTRSSTLTTRYADYVGQPLAVKAVIMGSFEFDGQPAYLVASLQEFEDQIAARGHFLVVDTRADTSIALVDNEKMYIYGDYVELMDTPADAATINPVMPELIHRIDLKYVELNIG